MITVCVKDALNVKTVRTFESLAEALEWAEWRYDQVIVWQEHETEFYKEGYTSFVSGWDIVTFTDEIYQEHYAHLHLC